MLGQGAFFGRALLQRWRGGGALFPPLWSVVLGLSVLAGLAYGFLQRDAVLCVAQTLFGLLAAAARHSEKHHDE